VEVTPCSTSKALEKDVECSEVGRGRRRAAGGRRALLRRGRRSSRPQLANGRPLRLRRRWLSIWSHHDACTDGRIEERGERDIRGCRDGAAAPVLLHADAAHARERRGARAEQGELRCCAEQLKLTQFNISCRSWRR
jgi:hypothetical protein